MTDVEGDVEVRVIDPHRSPLVERNEREPLAVARHEMQPPDDLLDELLVDRRGAVKDHAAGHVHVRRVPLEMQEGAIEPSQPVRIRHRLILARIRLRGP